MYSSCTHTHFRESGVKVAVVNSVEELESFELDSTGKPGEDAVRAYERDGVVCLRGAFSDDWIEQGRRAIADELSALTGSATTLGLTTSRGNAIPMKEATG